MKAYPRLVYMYGIQENSKLRAASDADWAGCEATRRSTSGGFVMRGNHLIKAWSKTQPTIAMSTGEAELISCVKGSSELLGMKSTAADYGREEEASLEVDATAAFAMVHRRGLGRVRHLDVAWLWVQEKAEKKIISYKKVPREGHFADVFTKASSPEETRKALEALGLQRRNGRPKAAPKLQS